MGALSPWHILVILLVVSVVIGAIVGLVMLIVKLAKSKTQPAPQSAVKPGWYPDPHDPSLLRYYDGQAWTAHTQPRISGTIR